MNEKFTRFLSEVRGKRVAVLGMGVSNVPLIRILLDAGAQVSICDKMDATELDAALIHEFKARNSSFYLGKDYLAGVSENQIIIRSPGIRYDLPELIDAKNRGAIITSEMRLFFSLCPCPIIGITGSDGKTTTTSIVYELLKAAGLNCHIGGNIGFPLIGSVNEMKSSDIVVLELSSFQLMDMEESPQITVVTNVSPNHLDVHKSMKEYIDAKKNIYRYQKDSGRVVLNYDNEITRDMAGEIKNQVSFFSRRNRLEQGFSLINDIICKITPDEKIEILKSADIKIAGGHNIENFLAAIAATDGLVKNETVLQVARSFNGVMHRLELVRKLRGVSYHNDSIASSPTRTIAGLNAFDEKVVLIAGGYDKKIPFDELGREMNVHVKALILVGETSAKIKDAVISAPNYNPELLEIYMCDTFEETVTISSNISKPGDNVLLSPACASFDMFKNFELRGNKFKELVNELD